MAKKNGRRRSPEEAARREKIRELLNLAGVNGMEDIQELFRETIAEFMENGLDAEMDEQLGYDTRVRAAIPPEEPAPRKRGRKPKPKD